MPTTPRRVLLLGTENSDGSVTGVTATIASQPIFAEGRGLETIFLRSVGTTSGGTVLVEEADWGPLETPYSGTWSTLQTILASAFTGGAQLAYHPPVGSFRYIRVRISSAITGGGSILASLSDMGQS